MLKKPKIKTEESKAQSAAELAIFGAILVFVLGLLIKYAVSFNFTQELPMRAFRQAFLLSSQGGRLNASVVIIEDRDLPDVSNPLGTGQRTTYSAQGSVSANNVLFANTDFGNQNDLPYIEFYINGKHYSFTTAAWMLAAILPPGQCGAGGVSGCYRTKVTRGHEWFKPLYCMPNADLYWCWVYFSPYMIDPQEGKYQLADVDKDNKEEFVVERFYNHNNCAEFRTAQECNYLCRRGTPQCCTDYCNSYYPEEMASCMTNCTTKCLAVPPTDCYDLCNPDYASCMNDCQGLKGCKVYTIDSLRVLDYQEGDLDLTFDSYDIKWGKTTQGLRINQNMTYLLEPGSSHLRKEDINKIIDTMVIKRKDSIERIIQTNRIRQSQYYVNDFKYCSPNVINQVNTYAAAESDPKLKDYCNEANGELHVFSKFTVGKTRTWTTLH